MAVQSTQIKSSLVVRYKDGIDASGKDVVKTKRFSNIKLTADNQGLYDVATAIAPLMKYGIAEILRSNDMELNNA